MLRVVRVLSFAIPTVLCGEREGKHPELEIVSQEDLERDGTAPGNCSICRFRDAMCECMVTEFGPRRNPPVRRFFTGLTWLGFFLLLLLAGQGCGDKHAEERAQSEKAFENGLEANRKHDDDQAITQFSESIRLRPDNSMAYYNRGNAYSNKRDYDKAIADYTAAIRIEPDYIAAYNDRANAYGYKNDWTKAIADETEAIRLNPDFVEAHYTRGLFYERTGDYDKAAADLSEAVRLNQDFLDAYFKLAWLLATCPDVNVRNGEYAVQYALKACDLTQWKDDSMLSALAAAYAEAGRFDDAAKWQTKYLDSDYLKTNPSSDTLDKARRRLSLYEQKMPYHEAKP
jgi:Flp pilus assembly protein TadD